MKARYLLLVIGIVVIALALTLLGRPRPHEAPVSAPAPAPVAMVTLTIEGGRLSPAITSVAKGTQVRLRVDMREARGVRLALAGYQDRLAIPALEPGTTWSGEFIADRPGEDFAWLIDGIPAGRLLVTGSHLVEGHR